MVQQVAFVPEDNTLSNVLRGGLATVTCAANKKRPDLLSEAGLMGDLISPVSVVAGTGSHLCRTRVPLPARTRDK